MTESWHDLLIRASRSSAGGAPALPVVMVACLTHSSYLLLSQTFLTTALGSSQRSTSPPSIARAFSKPPINISQRSRSRSPLHTARAAPAACTISFPKAITGGPIQQNPNGPYIQRDGMSNPDNFVEHRRALMRLSVQVPALAAAWKLTQDKRYATQAAAHLRAWFIDERTRMNPNLQYAQAIHGRFTGRGIGIIDTIHLVEVARAIEILKDSRRLSMTELGGITQWFKDYLAWMTTSKNGIEERDAKNNHGTCWVMQVAAFAQLTGDQKLLDYCRDRFKTVIVPNQIAADGSFPGRVATHEALRLFALQSGSDGDCLSDSFDSGRQSLGPFKLADGRGFRQAMEYMAPFIRDKKSLAAET